ncbi:MAG: helix-turn-helix domain-containing protein [Oscillospiraceae bacterium]|jgi:excisionase family DNA binding protein|nr:helix-turn-helix domain-containing protein [Oscillospiraceae bacterium]
MSILKTNEAYQILFPDYPDVVNIKQLCEMLGGICEKTGYRLLHSGKIKFFTVGRCVRIPKIHVIDYLSVAESQNV